MRGHAYNGSFVSLNVLYIAGTPKPALLMCEVCPISRTDPAVRTVPTQLAGYVGQTL